ncbi:MAG: hypothetical protein ACOX2F_07670 [bacterium]
MAKTLKNIALYKKSKQYQLNVAKDLSKLQRNNVLRDGKLKKNE